MSSQVTISRASLLSNLKSYKKAVGQTALMAVVKSNAYGHGIIDVAGAIQKDVNWFGVVSGTEALALRIAGIKKPILVLSFYSEQEIPDLIRQKISLVVYDVSQVQLISQAAKKLRVKALVHVKIDSGTSRLGILPDELDAFVDKILRLPNVQIEGILSHFAASEDSVEFTAKQNRVFRATVEKLQARSINPLRHIACTAAGLVVPESRHDLVRLGIGLYGLWPSVQARATGGFSLQPVLSWQTQILQVKTLLPNTYVGYGLSYKTTKRTKLAILPVGYYDGYDRKLSNTGEVLIGNKRCKVLGRVCMNLIMIDVTDLKNVSVGNKVVLIGKQGHEEITADELAEKIGTINYEVVTRINPLIPRILK